MTERAAFPVLFGYRADEKLQDIRRAGQHFAVVCIPWAMIAPHDEQAQRNHSQTLSRLAGRGGLSAAEAIAVLEDRRFTNIPEWTAHARLARMVLTFTALPAAPDSGENTGGEND